MRPSRARSVRPIRGATRRRKAPVAPPSFGYSIQVACLAIWYGIISSSPASPLLAITASPGAARRAGNGRPRADPPRSAVPFGAGNRSPSPRPAPLSSRRSATPRQKAGMSVSFEPRLPLFNPPSVNPGDPLRQSVGVQVSYIIKVPRCEDRPVVPPEVVAYSKIGRGLTWRLHCDSVAVSPTGSLI